MDKPKSQGSSKVRPRDLYSSSGDDVVNEDVVNEGDKGNREKVIESDHESDSDGDEEVFLAEDNSGKAETPLPPLPPKPTLPPQTLQPLPKTPETRRRSSSESDLNKSPATKANPNAPAATTPQPARKKREKEGFFSKINLFNKKDKSGSHTSIKASTESLSAQSGATASSTIPLTQKQEIARLKFFLDLFKEMKREQKNAEIGEFRISASQDSLAKLLLLNPEDLQKREKAKEILLQCEQPVCALAACIKKCLLLDAEDSLKPAHLQKPDKASLFLSKEAQQIILGTQISTIEQLKSKIKPEELEIFLDVLTTVSLSLSKDTNRDTKMGVEALATVIAPNLFPSLPTGPVTNKRFEALLALFVQEKRETLTALENTIYAEPADSLKKVAAAADNTAAANNEPLYDTVEPDPDAAASAKISPSSGIRPRVGAMRSRDGRGGLSGRVGNQADRLQKDEGRQ